MTSAKTAAMVARSGARPPAWTSSALLPVFAQIEAPSDSRVTAISWALRVAVPLGRVEASSWLRPLVSGVSEGKPAAHGGLQMDERHAVVRDQRELRPLGRVWTWMSSRRAADFADARRGRGVQRIEDGEGEPLVGETWRRRGGCRPR